MKKEIKQYRYHGENNSQNYPADLKNYQQIMKNGTKDIFAEDNCYPIVKLGIQTLPGTQFYLNNSDTSIIVGSTGIYEIDVEGYTEIVKLLFDGESLNTINNNNNAYLIVDMICKKEVDN